MNGPQDLVATVGHLENLLHVRFHRHIEVEAPALRPCDFEALRQWLRPVCDTFTCTIGRLNGVIPPGLHPDDSTGAGAGLSCKVDTSTPVAV